MIKNNFGFTLIELVVVMVVVATLFGMVMFSLIGTQKTSEVGSAADALISDMASQQTKAMLGAGTASGTKYGIFFDVNKYTLFQGNFYLSTDPRNFTVNLDSGLAFTNIKFPGSSIIFSSATGTVSGYLNGSNYVSIGESDGSKVETIKVNRYGVVTQEN
jgi:prepilin-type N-terminal cleavage/methylation domain-containing protein